jgi:hypothetical protein|tara:strand:+ start:2863 stop:3288 length:426 start_codon:yes stop_codon:yes gene_type:complete
METQKKIHLDTLLQIATDHENTVFQGTVQFNTTPPKGWVQQLMDMGITKAETTVNCSRLGKNPECNTSIFELQNHNHHTPIFNNEFAMTEYINRILTDVNVTCKKIDMHLEIEKPKELSKLTYVLKQGYELQEGNNDDNAQ